MITHTFGVWTTPCGLDTMTIKAAASTSEAKHVTDLKLEGQTTSMLIKTASINVVRHSLVLFFAGAIPC